MAYKFFGYSILLLVVFACTNLDNANPTKNQSFIFTYGGTGNYQGVAAIELSDGYLVIGDSIGTEGYGGLIIKTNPDGKTQWRKIIKGARFSSIIPTTNGYLICGDSIKVDLTKIRTIDQVRTKVRLISIDNSGTIQIDKSFGDIKTDDQNRIDLTGNGISVDVNQNYIVTTTVSLPNSSPSVSTYTQVTAHDPANLNIKWSKIYNQDNGRDYKNGKSVLINPSGRIIWATSAFLGNSINSVSFLRIPVLAPDAAPTNGGTFGQDDLTNYYSGSDIATNNVSFGIIGTYQNSSGQNANLYFLRTDMQGNPITTSSLFFDGVGSSANKALTDKTLSEVQDQGITLTATADAGFLLAGSTTSTTDGKWGNGGKDVYLIRLDAFGNIMWNRFIGGSGDEVPSSIKQTSSGSFLICGTATLANQSSIFLLKTNKDGELKN